MGNMNLSKFLDRAVSETDHLETYIDVAVDKLEKLTDSERQELLKEIEIGRGQDGKAPHDGQLISFPVCAGGATTCSCSSWESSG